MILVAVDGTHHAILRSGSSLQIGCAEDSSPAGQHTVITQTDWLADIAANIPLSSGGYTVGLRAGATGTPYFWIMGSKFGSPNENVGIRYKILASGNIVVDGGLLLSCNNVDVIGNLVYGGPMGVNVINGEMYMIVQLGTFFPSNEDFWLIRLPLEGDLFDLISSGDSFRLRCTSITTENGGDFPTDIFSGSGVRQYYNRASITKADTAGNIGVFVFNDVNEPRGCECLYGVFNPLLQTQLSFHDLTSQFGLPFADTLTLFDGSPSSTDRDMYTGPSVAAFSEGFFSAESELFFTRGYSDNPQWVNAKRFSFSGPGNIEFLGDYQFQLMTTTPSGSIEHIQMFREGDEVVAMMRDNDNLNFGNLALPDTCVSDGDCPTSGVDLNYPPCATKWTQCVRIVRRDDMTFRFTTLDRDVDFRGDTYLTCNSLVPSAVQAFGELSDVGSTELAGILAAGAVDEADLYGGLFDDAFVELWRVPYEGEAASSGDIARRLGAGWVGKVSQSARGYKMEVLGPGARLDQRPIVQTVTPHCRWKFGDAATCGVDVESLAIAGVVTSGTNRGIFLSDLAEEPIGTGTGDVPSSGELPAQYVDGRILWRTGVNTGQITETKSVDFLTGQIVLWAQTAHVPEAGDTFDLLPGCALDWDTCREVYDNGDRFGGFPWVPGQDAIVKSPNVKSAN